jgi:hypothetical protein
VEDLVEPEQDPREREPDARQPVRLPGLCQDTSAQEPQPADRQAQEDG